MHAGTGMHDGVAGIDLSKPVAPLEDILKYLKAHNNQLDSEIAKGMDLPLANVCLGLSKLQERGDVVMCRTTRYAEGRMVEGMLCRLSGYFPPAAPGRKPKGTAS